MKILTREWPILIGKFGSGMLTGLAFPIIHKEVISAASSKFISAQCLLQFLTVMLVSFYWEKLQKRVMKYYLKLEITESIIFTLANLYFFFHWNAIAYYTLDIISSIVVGGMIGKFSDTFYTYLYRNADERINADSHIQFFRSLSSIIGYGLGLFFTVPLKYCVLLFIISDLFRTIGNVITIKKYGNQTLESQDDKLCTNG